MAVTQSQNVAVVREIFEIFNREGVGATARFVADDLEAYPFPEWVTPGPYHGMAGVEELVGEWTENFDEYRWEVEHVLDAPHDRVVVLAYQTGRTKDQGVPMRGAVGAVYALRDRRVYRMHYFLTWDEARSAAGLQAG